MDRSGPYERAENDAFYTEPELATAAIGLLIRDGWARPGCSFLEPSVGRGAFARAVHLALTPVRSTVIDVDSAALRALEPASFAGIVPCFMHGDFLSSGLELPQFELIAGNPPFGQAVAGRKVPVPVAERHVRKALALRDRYGCAAFLLRMTFLESEDRIPFWREHPASKIYALAERPSFTGNGKTDKGQAYGFFVWATWHRGPTTIETVSWRSS